MGTSEALSAVKLESKRCFQGFIKSLLSEGGVTDNFPTRVSFLELEERRVMLFLKTFLLHLNWKFECRL